MAWGGKIAIGDTAPEQVQALPDNHLLSMNDDLGLSFEATKAWFPIQKQPSHIFVRLTATQVAALPAVLGMALRRCYLTDERVNAQSAQFPHTKVIAAGLPDRGATMAGDFGEILTYFYQGVTTLPTAAIGLKKWRLKQDRKKPAPYSDVVHLVLPDWPKPSAQDAVLCSEVKTKSTAAPSTPIQSSIEDCDKDRTSRLAKTLLWLRDRAITGSAEGASYQQLNRFIENAGLPTTDKRFQAVSVICESLVKDELANVPSKASSDYTLVVISVPNLKATYEAVFTAAMVAVPPPTSPAQAPKVI